MDEGHRVIYVLLAVEGLISLLALIAVAFHLRNLQQQRAEDNAAENDAGIKRSVANLSGRLVAFEARMTDLTLRIDQMTSASVRQEQVRTEWMREMQETSLAQLETIRRIDTRDEKRDGLIRYIHNALSTRPCIRNEEDNGDESCPDGQPIEGAGKMKPYDPNER